MCMRKLRYADANVKRKEKGKGEEKSDGRVLRQYKKERKVLDD